MPYLWGSPSFVNRLCTGPASKATWMPSGRSGVASIGCSSFLAGFRFQKPLSQKRRSTSLPLQHAPTLIFSVDWGLPKSGMTHVSPRSPRLQQWRKLLETGHNARAMRKAASSRVDREKCKTQFSVVSSLPRKRESSLPNGGRGAVDSRFRGNDGWDSEFCTCLWTQIDHLAKEEGFVGASCKLAMMVSNNHSPSPTRCSYCGARTTSFSLCRGERLHRYDGDVGSAGVSGPG